MTTGEAGVVQKEEVGVAFGAADGTSGLIDRCADCALWDEVGARQAGCSVVAAV